MSAFRSAALLIAAVFAAQAVAAASSATTIIMVDGAVQHVPSDANAHNGYPMIALEPLAHKLGMQVRRVKYGMDVAVDDSWVHVAANDITVRQDGAPMMRLSATPVVRHGELYVSARDVGDLLDVAATIRSNQITIENREKHAQAQQLVVRDLPTPTPPPIAPTSAPIAYHNSNRAVPANRRYVGHASFELMDQAQSRYYQGSFDGTSGNLRASLFATGSPGSRPNVGGTVTMGTANRYVALGAFSDPLYGEVFAYGGTNGIDLQNAAGTNIAWGNSQFGGRHIFAVSAKHRDVSEIASLVWMPNYPLQPLLGVTKSTQNGTSEFDRELWVAPHGIAAGLHFRKGGKFYTEERLGFAGPGLPLTPGDAPTQIDAGYDFSSALGARAGFYDARGQYGQPFVQLYGHAGWFDGSISHESTGNVITAGYRSTQGSGYITFGRNADASFVTGTAQMRIHRGLALAEAYGAQNSRDEWAEYQFNATGPGPTLGVESVASGNASRFGPIVGVAMPIAALTSARVEFHPLAHGNGIRFSVQQTLTARMFAPQARYITVGSTGAVPSSVYVLVDGVRTTALTGGATRVAVPDGNHYVSLESDDGEWGSPEARVVDGNPKSVSLPLWTVVQVRGVLHLPSNVNRWLGGKPSVANLTVVIQPGNFIAQTDESGSFNFPAIPLAPGSTISVDGTTLPDGLAPPAAQSVSANAAVTITLRPSKKIETITF